MADDDDFDFDLGKFVEGSTTDKLCSSCGMTKPLSEFGFRKTAGIYRSDCKDCRNQKAKDFASEHKDHVNQGKKESYHRNKETINERAREARAINRAQKEAEFVPEPLPTHKTCKICEKEKELQYFNKGSGRYKLSNWCKDCEKEYYQKNFEHIREQRKGYRYKNREKSSAYNKEWYNKNLRDHPDKRKEKSLKHYFDLTLEQFNALVASQDGECKICEVRLDMGKGTHVDHDHITGDVRGVLCHPCNTKLGWYEKNSAKVEEYLSPDIETDVENFLPSWAFLH